MFIVLYIFVLEYSTPVGLKFYVWDGNVFELLCS